MPGYFEDIEIGQVVSLGRTPWTRRSVRPFADAFAPGWDPANGAPDAMVYAVWSRLDLPGVHRLAADQAAGGRRPALGAQSRRPASSCADG